MPSIGFYREQFNFELPSHQIPTRHAKFIDCESARIDSYRPIMLWDIGLHYYAWLACQFCD